MKTLIQIFGALNLIWGLVSLYYGIYFWAALNITGFILSVIWIRRK